MTDAAQTNPQPRGVVLLQPVPGRTVIHDLWAGTKLIIVFAAGVLLTFYPGWLPIAMVALLVAVGAQLARIPRGVLPSIPKWLWVLLALGAITASFAGGTPVVALGSLELGLGGLLNFLRITALSVVLLLLGGMVSWTTNVADVAPAVATLGRPLRRFLPIEDWAVALALALRSFPMLIDEFRVLYAARKLRPKALLPENFSKRRRWAFEMVDLLAAAITVTLRRGDEMGDAITARGGSGQIAAAPSRPVLRDWVALAITAVVCVVAIVLELTVLGTSAAR